MIRPRPLTHDERKAAEAAFRGLPLNPTWTEGAKAVYCGVASALHARKAGARVNISEEEQILDLETASV